MEQTVHHQLIIYDDLNYVLIYLLIIWEIRYFDPKVEKLIIRLVHRNYTLLIYSRSGFGKEIKV